MCEHLNATFYPSPGAEKLPNPETELAKSLRWNILSNYFGVGWSALMGILFVPVYITYLGVEAYGLIGLFALLQAWLLVLDLGLSPTLAREMARLDGSSRSRQNIRDLLRSVEIIYLIFALAIALMVYVFAPWIAAQWLTPQDISIGDITSALSITGVVIALRWMGSPYRSAITGLQEQVRLNVVNVVFSTLRGLGVVAVLEFVSPTILAFFIYQGVVAVLELATLCVVLYKVLPQGERAGRFSLQSLRSIASYASGLAGIVLLSMVLTQTDKVILSGMLPLAEFGQYALASAVATALAVFVSPIATAVGPKLARFMVEGADRNLAQEYHSFCQLMSVSAMPPAITVALFSDRVMMLWTNDATLAASVAPVVSLLTLGFMVNGWMNVPYLLQLAFGWTRFGVVANLVAIIGLIPALLIFVPQYGAIGAATIWLLLNVGYVIIGLPLMHRRLLPGELRRWYLSDVAAPLVSVALTALIWKFLAEMFLGHNTLGNASAVLVAATLTFCAALASTHAGRLVAKGFFQHLTGRRYG